MSKYASKVIDQAKSWIGKKESNGTHKAIIDIYNAHKPLARSYKVKYTDAWCATFVSAVAIKLGYTDIIPTECGCEEMIKKFKKLGIWIENENRVPTPGEIIFYDWDDNGIGDNKGYSDHVGIVEKVSGSTITVIEGNKNNAVERRNIAVNAKTIRGYGVPKYDKESTPKAETKVTDTTEIKLDYAKSFSKSVAKTYKTTANLNLRCGAGTSKKIITVIPSGKQVTCYGYFTPICGTKWLLVKYNNQTGFVSSAYLR